MSSGWARRFSDWMPSAKACPASVLAKFDMSVCDNTWRHRVDADATLAQLDCEVLHQRVDRALRCRIGRNRPDGGMRRQRRDNHDAAVLTRDRQQLLDEERRADVDGEEPVEILDGGRLNRNFAEQIERLLMMVLLVFFGAAIADAFMIVFLIRPLCGWIGLAGFKLPRIEKAVIAFFGIRGLGSFYYLAFALGQADFDGAAILWVTVCFVVLSSIVMHGVMVTPVMRYLDRRHR